MPFGCASDVLKFSVKALMEVHKRLEALSENDDFRQRIECKIKELQQVADELKTSGVEDLPQSSQDSLEKFRDSLAIGTCMSILNTLHSQGALVKFIRVNAHSNQLQTVERELENGRNSLQLALTRIILAQNESLRRCVEEGSARVETTVVHPKVGVYHGTSTNNKLTKPYRTAKPNVNVVGELMIVKWKDSENTIDQLNRYEVRYDDETGSIVPGEPHEFRAKESRTTFSVSLGPPKIVPGKLYTIQVRATNSQGPGEWSEAVVARFKTGPPNKPRKPSLAVISPTEVLVEVKKIKESDENGSPVQHCVVEYAEESDPSEWQRLTCPFNPRRRDNDLAKFAIKKLTPDCMYHFRVRMVNEAGESQPSDSERALTTQLIPGPPQELRISSKRTDKSIKVRWKAPAKNPQVVVKYEVQRQRAKLLRSEWSTVKRVTKPNKLSAVCTNLDTDTKYRFRVRAVSNKEEAGEYSEFVEGETRYGKVGRVVATTAAFIGGTVGGPLLGALGLGLMAGHSAGENVDSSAGKVAASAAAGVAGGVGGAVVGTIGAPIVGATTALMTYKKLEGKMADLSPQSSEDEDEDPSVWDEVVRMSLKRGEQMAKKNDKL